MYPKEDLCLKAFFLLVKTLSWSKRKYCLFQQFLLYLYLYYIYTIIFTYTTKTATVLPCFVCCVDVSKINLKRFRNEALYFKASVNYLQLTPPWKPTEALCLDLEILKFIDFPLTSNKGQTKTFLQPILQPSVYPELSLLPLLPVLGNHYTEASQELYRALGFSTTSKALSPHSEEGKFCH